MNAVERLTEKINREYLTMRERWWDMTADELIENADKIVAAKLIMENFESSITDDEAEYLLGFKAPLAALIDTVNRSVSILSSAAVDNISFEINMLLLFDLGLLSLYTYLLALSSLIECIDGKKDPSFISVPKCSDTAINSLCKSSLSLVLYMVINACRFSVVANTSML